MSPILIKCAFMAVALLLAYFSFRRWLKNKRIWYIIAVVAAVLAAGAYWLSSLNGTILFVGAVLLFALGELFRKK